MRKIEAIELLNTLAKTSRTNSTTLEAVFTHVRPLPFLLVLNKALVLCDQAALTNTFRRYQDISTTQFIRLEYTDIQRIVLLDLRNKLVISSTVVRELELEFVSLDDVVEFQNLMARHGQVLREVNQVVWSRPNSFLIDMPAPPLHYGELYFGGSVLQLKQTVFERGLGPDARLRGWLLMLGLIPFHGDNNACAFANRDMQNNYLSYRRQWHRMTEEQKQQNTQLAQILDQIRKDLPRQCEWLHNRVDLDKVEKVLVAYVLYDADTNYAQGMNDIVAAILLVTNSKHLTFAIFKKFMAEYRRHLSAEGVAELFEMKMLKAHVAQLCPELPFHYSSVAFPWLMLVFIRQLNGNNFFRMLDMYFATMSDEFVSWFAATVFRHTRAKLMELGSDDKEITDFFEAYWKQVDFEFLFALFKSITHKFAPRDENLN